MGLENVIGNLLTCIIPLAGGSQVGLGGSCRPPRAMALQVSQATSMQPVGTWSPWALGLSMDTVLRLGAAVTCRPFSALPARLCVPCLAWLPTWHLSVSVSSCSLGVPVSGCPLISLLPGQYPHVWVRLTVSLCLSVLCSWTLLRMEWYGFFVSSAHPGPTLPQVRGPEVSLQHCSGRRARRGLSLMLCRLSWPVSPQPVELRADTGLVGAAEYWPLSFHREPSLWGLATGRLSRPRSPTRCPSAAAAWPCSSASWVSPGVPSLHSPPCPLPGGWQSEVGFLQRRPSTPVFSLQASPTCCLCSAPHSPSTRCSSCPGATSASRTPAGGSWRCSSPSDTGASAAASPPPRPQPLGPLG